MKPHLSIEQQVELLLQRGLEIKDSDKFGVFLKDNNYYRVRGYFHPFLEETENGKQSHFKPGTKDSEIVHLVEFDRNLRNFLFEALAIFETKLRSSVAYHAGRVSPYIHIDGVGLTAEFKEVQPSSSKSKFDEWTDGYKQTLEKHAKNDIVLKHFESYQGLIPIWAAVELLDLGKVSSILRAIEEPIANQIAEDFECGASLFKSVVATLNDLRNHVAHHSRIWNFHYPINPKVSAKKLPKELQHLAEIADYQRHKLYARLSLLLWLNRANSLNIDFEERLKDILKAIPPSLSISHSAMGWSVEFGQSPLWTKFGI